jgi:hypothetical protein
MCGVRVDSQQQQQPVEFDRQNRKEEKASIE